MATEQQIAALRTQPRRAAISPSRQDFDLARALRSCEVKVDLATSTTFNTPTSWDARLFEKLAVDDILPLTAAPSVPFLAGCVW